jgi:hypothetical protein
MQSSLSRLVNETVRASIGRTGELGSLADAEPGLGLLGTLRGADPVHRRARHLVLVDQERGFPQASDLRKPSRCRDGGI